MNRNAHRRLSMEPLEARQLLAADLHNFLAPYDVNDDGRTTAMDALRVINRLNARTDSNSDDSGPFGYIDVNDDGRVSSLDALNVINWLNQSNLDGTNDANHWISISGEGSVRAVVRLGRVDQGMELEVRLRGASSDHSYAVFMDDDWVGTLEVNERGRGHLNLRPDLGLDGQLPSLLAAGRTVMNIKIEGVGEVQILNDGSNSDGTSLAGDSGQFALYGARLRADGQVRGEAMFVQHGERKLLRVYARGLTAGESYSVRVGEVEVASLRANRAGVVIGRIDATQIDNFPTVQQGTHIHVAGYSGEFILLREQPRPDPPRDIYVARFRQERIFGNAELIVSQERTVLDLRLVRAAAESVHDIFIDDVKIAEVRAGRNGVIEFRYDSHRGDTLLAPIPTITNESVIRIGTLAHARLIKVGPNR